ncbi:MAG: PilN domain-containing protein [Phycisphaerales bacterium]|jgi:Tfp pilus assembly protein PilN|nr:PilN domain-containing protein [Phycisphaerales bacterium]
MNNPFKRASGTASVGGSFLPGEYVVKKAETRASLIGLSLFGLVMLGVVGAFFMSNRRWSNIRQERELINTHYTQEAQKIEQLKQLESQRGQMLDKAGVVAALIEKVPRSILMAELTQRMPKDVTLLEMELKSKRLDKEKSAGESAAAVGKAAASKVKNLSSNAKDAPKKADPKAKGDAKGKGKDAKDGAPEPSKVVAPRFEFTLTLGGVAGVNNDIASYLGNLQACPLFESVELQYIKEAMMNDLSLRRFEITARLKPEADWIDVLSAEDREKVLAARKRDPLKGVTLPATVPGGVKGNAVSGVEKEGRE